MPLDTPPTASLNSDVLLNIMNFSGTATICRLMQISRELYHQGPKLLIPPLLLLQRESHLESFIAFLSSDAPYRFEFLKGIYITIAAPSTRVAAIFVDFLVRFDPVLQLQVLGLEHAETFLAADPRLADAFAKLDNVECLEMGDAGPATTAILERSEFALDDATFLLNHTPAGESLDGEETSSRNPIRFLHKSRNTLRSLAVSWSVTGPLDVLPAVQYPRLTTLHLGDNEAPLTIHYVHAFPNLDTLTVCTAQHELAKLVQTTAAIFNHHNMNAALQVQHGTWSALESVTGWIIDLYLLALRCPVRRLTVYGPRLDHYLLQHVLLPAQPAHLHLDFFDVCLFEPDTFGPAMSGLAVASLRSLEISLVLGIAVHRDSIDMAHTLVSLFFSAHSFPVSLQSLPHVFCRAHTPLLQDMLVEGLAALPIHSLGLTICCGALNLPDLTPVNIDLHDPNLDKEKLMALFAPLPPCAAETYLAALDLDALARRMQAAAPSLETVVITLDRHRARPNVRVVVGADAAQAWVEDAVERIPLRVQEAAASPVASWLKGAVVLKEKMTAVDRTRNMLKPLLQGSTHAAAMRMLSGMM